MTIRRKVISLQRHAGRFGSAEISARDAGTMKMNWGHIEFNDGRPQFAQALVIFRGTRDCYLHGSRRWLWPIELANGLANKLAKRIGEPI